MDSVIRGLVVYLILFVIFRISGNRTLSQSTAFDLVLLLIISETTQQAMVDDDHSMTNGFLLILTLIGMSILFSHLRQWFPIFDKWANGVPFLIYDNGRFLDDRMRRARISKEEILEAARITQGLKSFDEVAYAIVEPSGQITVIPKRDDE